MSKEGFRFSITMLLLLSPGSWAGSTEGAGRTSGEASVPTPQVIRAEGRRLFVEQIRPLLRDRCQGCHGSQSGQSGLDLSTDEGILKGGSRGVILVPGRLEESPLYLHVAHQREPHMPYLSAKLPEEIIALLAFWIRVGAPLGEPDPEEASAGGSAELDRQSPVSGSDSRTGEGTAEESISSDSGQEHWAYHSPQRPKVPKVKEPEWVRNPIDAFIAADRDRLGLDPEHRAEKRVLLRRLYLDLIGLPPTPTQLRSFLEDPSPDAYGKTVDALLSTPQYGERWGRHWMDVWRYSDWYGYGTAVRYSQRHIWRWRDWIVESLNQDKGYDRMIVEMLAGDEVAPNDPEVLAATGYLVRSRYIFNRNVWLQDAVDHAASAFLGITLRCARFHDHKYDPISQEEYYRFRAFFEPYDIRTDRVAGQIDTMKDGLPRTYDAEPREPADTIPGIYAQTFKFLGGDENRPDKGSSLDPGVPGVLGRADLDIREIHLPVESSYPALRRFVGEDLLTRARLEIEKTEKSSQEARNTLRRAQQRMDSAPAAAELRSGSDIDFKRQILPIFEASCLTCHDSRKAVSGLALDHLDSILEGGEKNGPAVIPKKSAESPLIVYLRGEKQPRMPLDTTPLPPEQISLISGWINQLPEEPPAVVLRRAREAEALALKELAWARAQLPALGARLAADQGRFSEPPDPDLDSLAEQARRLERRASLLRAEANLLRARQKLTSALEAPQPDQEMAKKRLERKIARVRKEVKAAEVSLGRANKSYTPLGKLYPRTSTGRRLALARWMASPENPLTARVAVAHMWSRHFGQDLIPTVTDLGLNGKPPTHPQLLDWLAVELMERNWSMKAIHRLMVTSNTYRMRSGGENSASSNRAKDPDNRYYWHRRPYRLEAEAVRDSLLQVAGQLDSTLGGPTIPADKAQDSYRRSLYFQHTPHTQSTFLKLFDAADPTQCYRRSQSIVPQQALALANSELSLALARLLGRDIDRQTGREGQDSRFIGEAFLRVLGRPPSGEEHEASRRFLKEQENLLQNPGHLTRFEGAGAAKVAPAEEPDLRARESLVHVLFNHNDFVTVR